MDYCIYCIDNLFLFINTHKYSPILIFFFYSLFMSLHIYKLFIVCILLLIVIAYSQQLYCTFVIYIFLFLLKHFWMDANCILLLCTCDMCNDNKVEFYSNSILNVRLSLMCIFSAIY